MLSVLDLDMEVHSKAHSQRTLRHWILLRIACLQEGVLCLLVECRHKEDSSASIDGLSRLSSALSKASLSEYGRVCHMMAENVGRDI